MKSAGNIFSVHSDKYKKYRPAYPGELFEYLASTTPFNEVAWDAGCGSGQASVRLSEYFKNVIGTDSSEKQIKNAEKRNNIRYIYCPSENCSIETGSTDLVTCAQSIHWFDLQKFYREASRVLKPGGVIAAWTYNLFSINKEIDKLIHKFYYDIIFNYWPVERRHVENGYKDIKLPFRKIKPPNFSMSAEWSLEQLTGYINTWSGVLNYIELEAFNPLEFIEEDLHQLWNEDKSEFKIVTWPLTIIAAKKPG